jgi:hypothetical protein
VKISLFIICILLAVFSWGAIRQVWAADPCAGGVYANRPALIAECLHQLTIKSGTNDAYPPPIEPPPYPGPEGQPVPDPVTPKPSQTPRPPFVPTAPPEDYP